MNAPARFLMSFAQSLSTMMLYPKEHPSWARAVDVSYAQLLELQKESRQSHFSFIGGDVIYGRVPLHDLKNWPWSQRLSDIGIQRLELHAAVSREEYESFLAYVLSQMIQNDVAVLEPRPAQGQNIRFGAVVVHEEDGSVSPEMAARRDTPTRGLAFELLEEINAVKYMQDEVMVKESVPIVEADAVVRSLTVAMRGSSSMIVPLLRLKASDPYNAIHSINASVLTMALAEFRGMSKREVHEFGTAALLHDMGMARLPRELLAKPTELTDRERELIEHHPIDGARIIMASDKRLDIAAIVAYEHHLRPDGTGYPVRPMRRAPHYASRFIRVCSVYNALRIARAHRPKYSTEQALAFIDERAGSEFDAEIATLFTTMMRKLDTRITDVDSGTAVRTPPIGMPAIPVQEIHH